MGFSNIYSHEIIEKTADGKNFPGCFKDVRSSLKTLTNRILDDLSEEYPENI